MNRRLGALAVAAGVATALAAVQLTASAATEPDKPSAPPKAAAETPQDLLSALSRDLKLTPAQVQRRLTREAAAAHTDAYLRRSMSDGYAGAWLSKDGGTLNVAVTDAKKADEVREAGANPVVVKRSGRQLDGTKAAMDRNRAKAGRDIHSWHVDVATNTVVVKASSAAQAKKFVAASGVTSSQVRVEVASAAPRLFADVRGGDAYYPGNARCSIGFPVSGGFVTAGHCGAAGTATRGTNGAAQGTVRGSSFPGNDYGWVQVNGDWAPRPEVNNYNGGSVTVAGSQEAAVGSSICRSGSTTGWHCGTINAKNTTVNYQDGPVQGLTKTNVCAEPGDSGGSWISGNQAQGVTSGGSGDCKSGGTTFFQPLNEILSAYGLTLTTTGGGGSGRPIVGLNNRCIDIPNSEAVDGKQLQMWDCNTTAAQRWTFMSDGSLQAMGKCMDVAWGSVDNGAVIQLANCSGNPAQKFVLSAAGDLVNPQANKCVDVKEWNQSNGAKLHIWECTGGANQKWRIG